MHICLKKCKKKVDFLKNLNSEYIQMQFVGNVTCKIQLWLLVKCCNLIDNKDNKVVLVNKKGINVKYNTLLQN